MALDRQQVATAGDKAQGFESSRRVDLDPQRLAGPQLVERPRGRIRAQERRRLGVVDGKAREHAADGVAAADALLAPITRGRRGRRRRVERRR